MSIRCALLNYGIYGMDAIRCTRGIVLIDEVDMHLHPTLQAHVLPALSRTFPCIQFIATTHAPMVMTGVDANGDNVVYNLRYDHDQYTITEQDTFGLDVSTITERILGQMPRDVSVDA